MIFLQNMEEVTSVLKENEPVLLYFSHKDCSVCHADFPKVEKIAENRGIKSYRIDTQELPEAAGQFTIFSVPAVLLFYQGKEYHRQARLLDFQVLDYRIEELMVNQEK